MSKNERVVVIDCETTTRNKGNPFDPSNKLCSVGILDSGVYTDYEIEYGSNPYSIQLDAIRDALTNADLVVGFNIKFDLHWIRRYLGDLPIRRLWDCQLGAYILSHQSIAYPSLDASCSLAGLGSKLDIVYRDYWSKGIDTPDIPYSILSEYLKQDVELTYALFISQKTEFEQDEKLFRLFRLGCEDLKWLQEAEWNGLEYDVEESKRKAAELGAERDAISANLSRLYNCDHIDWNSSDHISVVLFGGTLYYWGREKYFRTLKRGVVEKERGAWLPIEFPAQLRPDPRTETDPVAKIKGEEELARINAKRLEERQKPFVRTYSVAEGILRNYSPKGKVKKTIDLLLRRSELSKLISTYYGGIPELLETNQWDKLHGVFNQCVAKTGRLSSSKPNLQNFAGDIKYLFRSRYE